MLVSDIIDLIILQLGDETSDPTYLSRAQILQLINSCQRTLARELHCYTKFGWIWCRANKPKYTLDDSLEQLQFVLYDGEQLPPSTIIQWEKTDSQWREKRGTPESYALDVERKNVIWLYPCPDTDGDRFIKTSSGGVPYGIVDPYKVSFTSQTQDFTVGQVATGATSGASGTILWVEQDGYEGTLYFETNPGTFTDGEVITDGLGGSAVASGTTVTGGTDTWTFTRSYGIVERITGGDSFWDLVDENGDEVEEGTISEVWTPVNNLIYKYSYFPGDLTESDHPLRPFRNDGEIFRDYVMFWALMIDAEGQDLQKAAIYGQEFARKTGVSLTTLWNAQKTFPSVGFSSESKSPKGPRFPSDWPAVER